MARLPAVVLLLGSLSLIGACHRVSAPAPAPAEPATPRPAADTQTLPTRPAAKPTRSEALALCEAYMGFEKNDCLDKVKQDYAEIVASLDMPAIHGAAHAG